MITNGLKPVALMSVYEKMWHLTEAESLLRHGTDSTDLKLGHRLLTHFTGVDTKHQTVLPPVITWDTIASTRGAKNMNLQIALMVLLAETSREIIGKTPEQCGCTGPASALWLQQQPPKYLNRFTLISGNEILTMEQQMLSTSLARRMFRSRFPEAGFTDERIMSALAPLRTELN